MPRLKDALIPPANLSEMVRVEPPAQTPPPPPPANSMPGWSSLSVAPAPASLSSDVDRQRQFYRAGVSQQRISALPVKANPQVASIAQTIVEQSSSSGTTTTAGFNFRGAWANFVVYNPDDAVLFNNSLYFATQTTKNAEPDTNPSSWTLFGKNLNFRGQFQSQIVQTALFGPFGSGGQTITGTLANSTGGNSFVVVVYGPSRSFSTLACTDSQLNAYAQEEFNVTNVQTTAVFLVSGIKGGANTFTITCDNGHVMANTKFVVYEILGATTFGSATVNVTPASGAASSATTYSATCSAGQMVVSYMDNVSALGAASLGMAPGFNSAFTSGSDLSAVNMSPSPSAGVITAGFNVSTALTTVFAQLTFSINYTQARYEPFDVVTYEGSTYVCVASTSQTPTALNASWYLLSQGPGFAQLLAANYTATASDVGKTFIFSPTAGVLTLPATPPSSEWFIYVGNLASSSATISPNGALIDNSSANVSLTQNSSLKIVTDGINYYTVRGASSASGALTKIAEVVLSASQSTVTFSSIPATFRNLVLVINARTDIAASGQNGYIQFNGDTGANYSQSFLDTNGTTQSTGNTLSTAQCPFMFIVGASAASGLCTSGKIFINNYAGTTFFKNALLNEIAPTAISSTGLVVVLQSLTWVSTAAINSILIGLTAAGNYIAGSTFTLYGES